jgi:hypothetical protein
VLFGLSAIGIVAIIRVALKSLRRLMPMSVDSPS